MPKLIVLYPPPSDVATFERRYQFEHAPMVMEKIPGLKKFLAAQVLGTPAGTAPYQRVAGCISTRWSRCRRRWLHPADTRRLRTPWRYRRAARRSS